MQQQLSIRKTRRLRRLLAKHYRAPEPPERKGALVDQVITAVLWADASAAKARQACARLAEEFVDWNELRVTTSSEIAAVLEACGLAPMKAGALKRILGKAVEDFYTFDFEALREWPKKDIRAWFARIEGLPPQFAAAILYHVFGYDLVLVDPDVARVIVRLGLAPPEASEDEIEAAIEPVIPIREAYFIYYALRQHANTVCTKEDFDCRTCPLRGECDTGKARMAQLEAVAREARMQAAARAKARAKAIAQAKAAAERKRKAQAKPKPKAKPATQARKSARKKAKKKS